MGFSPDWLALREPLDHISRGKNLLSRVSDLVPDGAVVLDLGSGTGSTARAFAGAQWNWRFVDADRTLLDVAQTRHRAAEVVVMDMRDPSKLPLENVALVTASALLDLMPETWIKALAVRLGHAGIPLYAALNYNGKMHWSPPHPADSAVTKAFNIHQHSDKGIGPALGPDSADVTAQIFAQAGFEVLHEDSPWHLDPSVRALHDELLGGIAQAAAEAGCDLAPDWCSDRQANLAQLSGYIGHTDIVALPGKAAA